MAPNNDYMFDTAAMAASLAPHIPAIAQAQNQYVTARNPKDSITRALYQKLGACEAIKAAVGQNWAMHHSNQASLTVAAYQDAHAAIERRVDEHYRRP